MATTAQSPFFRLPRELRDAINGLVALDTEPLRYELSSKTGQPIQKKAPITSDVGSGCPPLEGEKEAYEGIVRVWQRTENTASENGLDRVCKQFIVEYSATLERRIESLISFGLGEPRLADFFWMRGKWVRLESSRAGSSTAPSIHALTIPVPVVSKVTTLHAVAYFTFRFHDTTARSLDRRSITSSLQRRPVRKTSASRSRSLSCNS